MIAIKSVQNNIEYEHHASPVFLKMQEAIRISKEAFRDAYKQWKAFGYPVIEAIANKNGNSHTFCIDKDDIEVFYMPSSLEFKPYFYTKLNPEKVWEDFDKIPNYLEYTYLLSEKNNIYSETDIQNSKSYLNELQISIDD